MLADRSAAIWLLPTSRFRTAVFASRGWEIPRRTSDPERARRNLLRRDDMFTDRLRAETARLGLRVLHIDGAESEEESAERVARTFGL